jgi:hypothetical protein
MSRRIPSNAAGRATAGSYSTSACSCVRLTAGLSDARSGTAALERGTGQPARPSPHPRQDRRPAPVLAGGRGVVENAGASLLERDVDAADAGMGVQQRADPTWSGDNPMASAMLDLEPPLWSEEPASRPDRARIRGGPRWWSRGRRERGRVPPRTRRRRCGRRHGRPAATRPDLLIRRGLETTRWPQRCSIWNRRFGARNRPAGPTERAVQAADPGADAGSVGPAGRFLAPKRRFQIEHR